MASGAPAAAMIKITEAADMRITIPIAIGGDLNHAKGRKNAGKGGPVGFPHGPLCGFGGADQGVDGVGRLSDGVRWLFDNVLRLRQESCRAKEQHR